MTDSTPSKLERFELKFTIPEDLVQPISDFVSIYCSLDKYSKKSDDFYYTINNLYFDSRNYLFLKKRIEGSEKRFNMRIRSYGDNSQLPYFVEVKQKNKDIVKKFRAKITEEGWQNLFNTQDFDSSNDSEYDNKKLFFNLALYYDVEPKVLTQYKRKAYFSEVDDYARVTFDRDLKYMPETTYNLIPDDKKLNYYDNSTIFDPNCNIILELKCYTTQVPYWMLDLIKTFNLQRRSFSKYMTGAIEVLNLYRYDQKILRSLWG